MLHRRVAASAEGSVVFGAPRIRPPQSPWGKGDAARTRGGDLCALRASAVKHQSAGARGEEIPISIDVDGEGVDREERCDSEGHRDEATVELVPVVGEAAVLPAQRLPGVTESEPRDGGADEDVLNDG